MTELQNEGAPLQPLPKKESPPFTTRMIPALSVLAGVMFMTAAPSLIGAETILDYIKCVVAAVSATLTAYGINKLAIEKGARQAAIGTPGAWQVSMGSVLFVGFCLFGTTYAGLVVDETDLLALEAFGYEQAEVNAEQSNMARQSERIGPVVQNIAEDLSQKAACEEAESCVSGRGNGGKGSAYRALLSGAQKAETLVETVSDGETRLAKALSRLRDLQASYQQIIADDSLSAKDRRIRAQAVVADIRQSLSALQEAMPVAAVAAYADSLLLPVRIMDRPEISRRINSMRSAYAGELKAVIASVATTDVPIPTFPARNGVSDTLGSMGHFLPIAMIVAVVELVFPITLWLYTYFAFLARLELPKPSSPAPSPRNGGQRQIRSNQRSQ